MCHKKGEQTILWHIIKNFRETSVLQLKIEGLAASKMNVLCHVNHALESTCQPSPENHAAFKMQSTHTPLPKKEVCGLVGPN